MGAKPYMPARSESLDPPQAPVPPLHAQPGGRRQVYRRLMQLFPQAFPVRQIRQQFRRGVASGVDGSVTAASGTHPTSVESLCIHETSHQAPLHSE